VRLKKEVDEEEARETGLETGWTSPEEKIVP